MAFSVDNFIFGEDLKDKSLPEFKAYMKRHKVRAKKATEIYNEIHGISNKKEDGNDSSIQSEFIEVSE